MSRTAGPRIRVLVADDHAVLRAGLRLLLDSQPDMAVAAEAADGPEAVRKTREVRPDVVVLDLVMPRTQPGATIAQIRRLGARVVVLTMHDDRAYLDSALEAGAQGYVVKRAADTELIAAIRAVSSGRQFVDATSRGPELQSGGRVPSGLSPRERRVVRLVAHGHTNREIAGRLGVSVKTVETFRGRACKKLRLATRAELVRYALHTRLMDADDAGVDIDDSSGRAGRRLRAKSAPK
jgi:DNA-binding NarL/FixJ family response regulator